ncbi:MAG TPA: hypothetical protein VER58_01450 [Thermoanaerobaculia bacterium]|nr:hypothetical protein [Thermoanaerobaculia bacterium]
MENPKSHRLIKGLIAPLAVFVVGKLLESPRARGALQEIDSRAYVQKRKVERSIKRARQNAVSSPAWLAAGAAAIAVGIGLMARAARGK